MTKCVRWGGRPIHCAREWQKASIRMEKEPKLPAWHKTGQNQISAPLIIDPTDGKITEKMRAACQKFGDSMGMDVVVKLRAGRPVKYDAKSEPPQKPDCMCCSTGNPGGCERNSIGYRISCECCQKAGVLAEYEGESGRNAYSQGLEH